MPAVPTPDHPAQPARVKPPRSVTFLSLGVLTIAGFYAVRVGLAVFSWQELAQFPTVSPGYITGVSLVWTGLAAGLWWALRRRKAWAPSLTRLSLAVFSLFTWLERAYQAGLTENGFSSLQLRQSLPVNWLPVNWPFLLVLNLVGILMVFWILSRGHVKEYFGEFNERKPKDRTSAPA
jgi:hypothetical protein